MGGVDKLTAELAGEPLVARPLRTLAALPGVRTLVLVAPAVRHAALRALLTDAGSTGVTIRCVEGGARRQDSVAAGMAAAADAAWYLVHDAARPLVSAALATAVLDAARASGTAAIPGLPVADTIKRVDADGRVVETLDRTPLRAVQTPQAFAGPVLRRAHREVLDDVTDDAGMVERLGLAVVVVAGEPANLKITTPADLELARAILALRAEATTRGGA
jgi:2-C-methyl-D-erythritol 4-phosphate cytidylyltransferase